MIQVGSQSIKINQLFLFSTQELVFENSGFYWITGANGSGKTTFLKKLPRWAQEQNPDLKEQIHFISTLPKYDRSLPLTGEDFFKVYTFSNWKNSIEKQFLFLGEKFIYDMSSGEFQALLLLSHLNSSFRILIMDEPFSHLSPEWTQVFLHKISLFSREKLIILANHQYLQSAAPNIQYLNISNQKMEFAK